MRSPTDKPGKKRAYRGTVQAEIKARTRRRILQAFTELFELWWFDEITLDQVAERAGVTVQTVLRHFGTKDGLVHAWTDIKSWSTVGSSEPQAIPGDVAAIVHVNVGIYERRGELNARILAQAMRYPALEPFIRSGRAAHQSWIRACFADALNVLADRERGRLERLLYTLTDYYTWHLYRHVYGQGREETERALQEAIEAALRAAEDWTT